MCSDGKNVDVVNRTLDSLGLRLSIPQLIDGWKSLVDLCELGYPLGMDELCNDLDIRDQVEMVLSSVPLMDLIELEYFRLKIREIDDRFKLLQGKELIDFNDRGWWRSRALRFGSEDLAEDYRLIYGVLIDVK